MIKAFSYMFKDNMILKKFLQLYGIELLGFLFLPIFMLIFIPFLAITPFPKPFSIALIGTFALIFFMAFGCFFTGYTINCIRAISVQDENIVLPFVEICKNIKTGFKQSIAMFLFICPWLLMILLSSALAFFPKIKILNILALIFLITLIIIVSILAFFTFAGFTWIFAHTENIESFLQFKKLKQIINYNEKQYILSVFLLFAISIINAIFSEICDKHLIFIFVYFLIIPYLIFVSAYINAKAISKEAINDIKYLLPIKKLKF